MLQSSFQSILCHSIPRQTWRKILYPGTSVPYALFKSFLRHVYLFQFSCSYLQIIKINIICFFFSINGFWSRRVEEERVSPTWLDTLPGVTSSIQESSVLHQPKGLKIKPGNEYWTYSYQCYFSSVVDKLTHLKTSRVMANTNDFENVKNDIKNKATRHSEFYKNLLNQTPRDGENVRNVSNVSSKHDREMSVGVSAVAATTFNQQQQQSLTQAVGTLLHKEVAAADVSDPAGSSPAVRQRKTGVFHIHEAPEGDDEEFSFPSVRKYINKYTELIKTQMEQASSYKKGEKNPEKQEVIVEEGYLVPPPSGYCSSSNNSDDEGRNANWGWSKKTSDVKRCCSSDSALGLLQSDEERSVSPSAWSDNKPKESVHEEIDPRECVSESVLTPYYNPNRRASIDHVNVPTRTLIEANIVPFPLNRKLSYCDSIDDLEGKFDSRRQSCFTDDGDEPPRYRYWRTPSVVVSDYSDDVIGGLTLEDIEYFRSQRKSVNSSPDSSLNSSCSNLNYCGSSVSVLDGDYTLQPPSRKSSDCSTLSTFSDDLESHVQPSLTNDVYGNKVSIVFLNYFVWFL